MNVEHLKEQLGVILATFPEIRLVYLFGSQVTGRTGPLSDIDLGVLFEREAQAEPLRARLAHELGLALHTDRIDIVHLDQAPIALAHAVIAQGTPVFQRDMATRVEYEARVMNLYGDYLPTLRAQRAQILEGDPHGARVQWYRTALERTERALSEIKAAYREKPH